MTVVVDQKKCNACRNLKSPQCVRLCPGDLMAINPETEKAFIREPRDCWDCMVCVKACPMRAIETHLPYQLACYGASLRPKALKDRIIWSLKRLGEDEEIFEIKTRF